MRIKLKKRIDDSYRIALAEGIFDDIPENIKKLKFGERYIIVTDTTVKDLYGVLLQKRLKKAGITSFIIEVKPGEKHKNIKTVETICEQMAVLGITRSDAVIALGGGVIGDIAGFVAAIYMRGIPFIQIPTTLLAMTDSSVGGKTGVDLNAGKNLIGAFYQPKKVYIDTHLLETLPIKERQCGFAEIIKHGVIADAYLFKQLEKHGEQCITLKNHALVNTILKRSVAVKAHIVAKDEKENRLRMILNYGHTIGHAIEHESEYKIPHGHAVSIGMHLINRIAREREALKPAAVLRIKDILENAGLPLYPPKMNAKKIISTMHKDKKKKAGHLWFVVPQKIGRVALTADITDDDVLWTLTTQD